MRKKLKRQKIFMIVFLIVTFVLLLSALAYKTSYNYIRIYVEADGAANKETAGYLTGESNYYLFDYFEKVGRDIQAVKPIIYNFQVALNDLNQLLFVFGVIALVGAALMILFGNNNRRIYYISNLVIGVLVPLFIVVMGIICVLKNTQLMGTFNENKELFSQVAVLQSTNALIVVQKYEDISVMQSYYNVSAVSFILYDVFLVLVMAYSIFIGVYTVIRYKKDTKRREEIISKAVHNND